MGAVQVNLDANNVMAVVAVFALVGPWVYLVTTESWLSRQSRRKRERIEAAIEEARAVRDADDVSDLRRHQ